MGALGGMFQKKHKGGLIKPVYAAGGTFAKGPDTVPAMLQPGEMVLPKGMTNWLKGQLSVPQGSAGIAGGGGGGAVNINISALDSQDVGRFLNNNKRMIADVVAGTTRDNHPNRKTG